MAQKLIGIHLDLKGMVHRPDYWPHYMADLAGSGINALLVEYEDVFPFQSVEVAFDPASCFTRESLADFLAAAKQHQIEIIPLQQCLGHLEYVFRWDRYADLAEPEEYPSTLALNNSRGRELVRGMLAEIVAAHPESRYLHLGMDEAHGLHRAARQAGRPVLEMFVEWLLELLPVVEDAGLTPIIWSDMLEDNFSPDVLEAIRDRVVLCPWDYGSKAGMSNNGRICGWRVSRKWLDEPADPDAPAIAGSTPFFEDLPESVREWIAPYREGRQMKAFYQVELWTKLGFRVIGATAIRASRHGAILPQYADQHANIEGFAEAISEQDQLGLIGTSWARGNTFCPNNYPIELAWEMTTVLAEAMGAEPEPFFGQVPQKDVRLLVEQLGRCREDWSIEGAVIEELEARREQVTRHVFEWDCLLLMARMLKLQRRVDFALAEVNAFRSAARPPVSEWQRRLDDQAGARQQLKDLRKEVADQFGQRYHGEHFQEWLADLFDTRIEQLNQATETCRMKLNIARERYR